MPKPTNSENISALRLNVIYIFVPGKREDRDLKIAELDGFGLRPDRHNITANTMKIEDGSVVEEVGELVAVSILGPEEPALKRISQTLKELKIVRFNQPLSVVTDNVIYFNLKANDSGESAI